MLNEGKLVEYDHPKILLENPNSLFAQLWHALEEENVFRD